MLENLFGSKTRVKLLAWFFRNPSQSFFVRELTRTLKLQINSIRRELMNLEKIGLIKVDKKEDKVLTKGLEKKYYRLNQDFMMFPELKTLFIKSQLLVRQNFLDQITSIGSIDYLVLTGSFIGEKKPLRTDMLIVGKVEKNQLSKLIEQFETDWGQKINYTVMTTDEFKYRKDITDKFLYEILGSKKVVVIDKFAQND